MPSDSHPGLERRTSTRLLRCGAVHEGRPLPKDPPAQVGHHRSHTEPRPLVPDQDPKPSQSTSMPHPTAPVPDRHAEQKPMAVHVLDEWHRVRPPKRLAFWQTGKEESAKHHMEEHALTGDKATGLRMPAEVPDIELHQAEMRNRFAPVHPDTKKDG